jgi:predicted RNA binding protein YcfA (HicA-like mRNA interferase family)
MIHACRFTGNGLYDMGASEDSSVDSDLQKAGFVNRGGKGSHRNFEHAASGVNLTLSGQTGADARRYQEKDVKEAIEKVTRK